MDSTFEANAVHFDENEIKTRKYFYIYSCSLSVLWQSMKYGAWECWKVIYCIVITNAIFYFMLHIRVISVKINNIRYVVYGRCFLFYISVEHKFFFFAWLLLKSLYCSCGLRWMFSVSPAIAKMYADWISVLCNSEKEKRLLGKLHSCTNKWRVCIAMIRCLTFNFVQFSFIFFSCFSSKKNGKELLER